ncbi:hypothetical protein J6TS1_16590 [Siminovitchia terrae]|uniref:Uncharacterized protein n=1 Tax=Siminovitchia terrae TaxID=1914933 RepID=A0A429X8M0_SIMTE|nr:hypothetical protein [Siminovitchia terrae]RST59805.1 hypothetical protein D5F11_010360 [Siminovitchia terrae]GIN91701.1 hypothetical protein J22TS1_27520 [Siminovitchia terrae]GIN95789.1 hypothetical protein J6TS1_16590 [Siminovitchia terrae]
MGRNQWDGYLDAIDAALDMGMAAKEVVCSITTGFRQVPSLRNAPGLNPYHATVADIGYGFDAVRGTIERLRNGEMIPLGKEMLVFDLDTLRISEKQMSPNFELVAKEATPDTYYLIEQSRLLNRQIAQKIDEANKYGKALLGTEWNEILKRIQKVQAIPRL